MNKQKNYITTQYDSLQQKEYFPLHRISISEKDKLFNQGFCSWVKTEDDLNKLENTYGHSAFCKKVIHAFEKFYGINLDSVENITNLTAYELNAHYNNGEQKRIIIDPILYNVLFPFFTVTFIWEDYMYHLENTRDTQDTIYVPNLNDRYFSYYTAIFHSMIVHERPCDIYKFQYIKEHYKKASEHSLLNLSVTYFYASLAFCIAHECAHAYFDIKNRDFDNSSCHTSISSEDVEEFEADKMAYDLLINLINEEESNNIPVENRELFNYSYLAPISLIDFFYVLFEIKEKVLKEDIPQTIKETILERRKHLVTYCREKEHGLSFDTTEGTIAYDSCYDVIATYLEMLNSYINNGRLNEILEVFKTARPC